MSKNIGNSTGPHLHFNANGLMTAGVNIEGKAGTPVKARIPGVKTRGAGHNIVPGRSSGPHLQWNTTPYRKQEEA